MTECPAMAQRLLLISCVLLLSQRGTYGQDGQTCASNQFTCREGQCIPAPYQCDRIQDCKDGSDETGCSYPSCPDQTCANGACFSHSQRCNGILDCRDGSDEANCTLGCLMHQFECHNGLCVSISFVCDHWDDCGDNSDEEGCAYPSCSGNQFTCASGRCIDQNWVCDGFNDCTDFSDEKGCDSGSRECYPGEWPCPSSPKCIPVMNVCDGHADCPLGEDETNSTANLKCGFERCAQLSCEYRCHMSPSGGTCYCPDGYILGNDGHSCVDYDDCNIWGVCEQLCEDSIGSHQCRCADGYILESGRRCKADISAGIPQLLFSNGRDVMIGDIHGRNMRQLIQSQNRGQALGVDYHWITQRVFWTDTTQKKVFSVKLDGTDLKEVLSVSVDSPENLAVDWITFKLYVVESLVDRIEVCDFSGANRVTLIAENLQNPHGLALDPTVGYMFFSDQSNSDNLPKLERAYMDGSHRMDLVKSKLGAPSGISLDLVTRRVYWADSHFDYIETVTYAGLDRRMILTGGADVPHPFGLVVFESNVYFTDWTKMGLVKANRFGGGEEATVLYRLTERPGHVVVLHPTLQPMAISPCGKHNGGCEQICVLSHRSDNGGLGFRCKCRLGYDLQEDGHSCIKLDRFLLFSSKNIIRGIPLDVSQQEDVMLPISATSSYFTGLDYDVQQETLYFSDIYNSRLYKAKIDGTGLEVILGHRIGGVEAMTFDWISKILFWTSSTYKTITAFKVTDKSRRDIITNLGKPRGIVVHPGIGYLFWTDWERPARIMRAWCDGSNKVPIVNTTLGWPNGIAIDRTTLRLYWVDALFDTIEHSDVNGLARQTFSSIGQITHPYSLAVHGEHLYVSDWRLQALFRVSKADANGIDIIRQGIPNIMAVKVYDVHHQTGIKNKCNLNVTVNGDCSHFCFAIPNGRVCGCPYGMKLTSDNLHCTPDNSTEPPEDVCGPFSFSCDEGRCIPSWYWCDGFADCLDKTDEANCTDPGVTCSPSAFKCGSNVCIPQSWRCDGLEDCADGSDEDNCPTKGPVYCREGFFSCENGNCVPISWLCDTVNDCGDGSDERNCNLTGTCQPGQFLCPDHRCISNAFVCDGDLDCIDGSDEKNCEFRCTTSQFACASGDQCIHFSYRCDGVFDCRDHSDEMNCPTRHPGMCHDHEFQCQSDGLCIPEEWECDRHPDCRDGSDEHNGCPVPTCRPNYFLCDNGNCVSQSWVCDGENDCRDMSDEKDCPAPPFQCANNQWKCPSEDLCIPNDKLCNGQRDCPYGEDESPSCNEDDCAVNNGGCTDGCIQGPFGAQCTCPAGFQLLNDSKTCLDIDECQIPGSCSQFCVNERGSYRCYCDEGYMLEPDGRVCKATDPREALLFITRRNQILSNSIRANPNVIHSVINDGINIGTIDFDAATDTIFWADTSQKMIWSALRNGTDRKLIFYSGVTLTENIAVDWVGRNLYWIDSVLDTIEVSTLDGRHRTVLLSENITSPRGLALDPRNHTNVMFWMDWGQNPRIERASMDGLMRRVILTHKLYWPNGLTIDYPTKRLYFADAYLDYIDSCDYDGLNRQQVLAGDLVVQHPHSITIFEDHIYWTERYSNQVIRVNKWHGGNKTVVMPNVYEPLGLVLDHPVRQPKANNPCLDTQCGQLCLLSSRRPHYYSCACQSGWNLGADGHTCERDRSPFLMTVRDTSIVGIPLDPNNTNDNAMTPVSSISHGWDLDFDDAEDFVYWVEKPGAIHRVKSDGTNRTEFAPAALIGSPSGLAFDWIGRMMYYTNPTSQTIEVIRVDGEQHYRKTIIGNTGKPEGSGQPVGIALDPARGKLYWTDQGTESGVPPKVGSADMDGSNLRNLFTDNLMRVEFICVDISERRLYWGVASTGVIETGNVDGSGRRTVVSGLSHPWGLAVHQKYLYYTDVDYEVIERVDKGSGAGLVVMRSNVPNVRGLRVYYRDKSAGETNGCSNNNGGCQQLCLAKDGGQRSCGCTTGFEPTPDGLSCTEYESFAVVSTYKTIRGFHINSSDHSEAMVPISGQNRYTIKLDVHVPSGFVYWADNYANSNFHSSIWRVKTDGSWYTPIVTSGVGDKGIQGLAVDWVAGNVYFTNAYSSQTYVEILRLNTTYRLVLLKSSVDRPQDIAVSPRLRFLFWTDGGQTPKIERALLDGTNRTVLASSSISTPTGLAVDYTNDFLYWTDDSLDMISSMRYDGTQRQIIRYGSRYPTPAGISIFGNNMIWVDRNLKKIFQASKQAGNSDSPDVIRDNLSDLRDVVVFDPHVQPISANLVGFNPCLEDNGRCQQFCFAIPGQEAAKCGCAHGSILSNGVSCGSSLDEFLIYTTDYSVNSARLDPDDHSLPFTAAMTGYGTVALDFDFDDKKIYFTQSSGVGRSRISYISTTASSSPPITVASDLGDPAGIAYDWIHRRLYVSDYNNQSILSMSLEGKNRTYIAHVPSPRAIIVDPCKGYMYWTDWSSHAKIERATLGGNFRVPIINSSLVWPSGLTLDYEDGLLYWADTYLKTIERSSLTGANRQVIVGKAFYPFAMTVYQQHIFWTDWDTRSIYRANKDDGSGLTVLLRSIEYRPHDIHISTPSRQQKCGSACEQFNGGCSHVCVSGPSGAECQCPSEGRWYLANNGKDCIKDEGARCGEGQFTCLTGQCISERWKCNGYKDCADNSDELERVCAFHTCLPMDFTCDNGRCVPYAFRCDHFNDCGDYSDEVGCAFPTCNPSTEFTCSNGRCISQQFVCDGINHCLDSQTSDEINCPNRTCPAGTVKCTTTNICIPPSSLCDGFNNCGDNSDEDPMFCHTRTCEPDEHLCDSGKCIPSFWVCDGFADCLDGSDEPPSCEELVETCHPEQFTCTNGHCIPASMVCDGNNDCGDMSDEHSDRHCDEVTCRPDEFTCPLPWYSGPRCIPKSYVCDGERDCSNAADELQNCTTRQCHANEFRCTNGLCIPLHFRCDRRNDCGDGSDEKGCTYPSCSASQFTCQNGMCIPSAFVCDGDNDCWDNSDELDSLCRTPVPTCAPGQFQCSSGECIDLHKVCNGQNDCNDMSDERRCGVDECADVAVSQCAQNCTNTLTSYFCSCWPGYRLMPDGKACEDIDECSETPAVCSQICENSVGSFHCKCASGYIREPDGHTCRHNSPVQPYLLFSNGYYIRNLTTDGGSLSIVLQGLTNGVALDFDHYEQRLYWIDVGEGKIERMFFNGTGRETIIDHNVPLPEGLAIDWVGRKMYWTDATIGAIHVSELDGRFRRKLISNCVGPNHTYCFERPQAVAVNPKLGWLYWTDWGQKAFIGRAGMDGQDRSAIITTKIEWPYGLTIDYTTDKIFFTDAHLDYLEYANMDGSNRHIAISGGIPYCYALTLFEDMVYWTDWNTKTVETAHKYTGAGRLSMMNITHKPNDIHVYHPYRQPRVKNPCDYLSEAAGCSHLCLIAGGGQKATCECPDHFIGIFVGFKVQCVPDCSSTQFRCADNEKCIPIWWKCDKQKDCRDGSDEPTTCPVRFCPRGQFQCYDGNCTSSNSICNGLRDCPDGSDEDPVLCTNHRCEENQFQCNNKQCIPLSWHCNGNQECSDGSDEDPQQCQSKTCSPREFQCKNGYCISQAYVCDMENDCGDHSDEPYDECVRRRCDEHTEFSCKTNYRCIPQWQVCDGYNNCLDSSDEKGCDDVSCDPLGDFRCENHLCIPLRYRCDGNNDCGDGSDEKNCSPRLCSESEFRCDNQMCIPGVWVCNQNDDCGDNSDERDCEYRPCLPGYFQCSSGHCIPSALECDGHGDCLDYSDETSCPTRFPGGAWCPTFMFECNNHICIQNNWLCDGFDDCGDNTDEEPHTCSSFPCSPPERFVCNNKKCIHSILVCDQVDNCGDNSDESLELCQEPTPAPCTTHEFKCMNGHCVPLISVCDHYDHCGDKSDELGCHFGSNRTCKENACKQNCTDLNGIGFICSCKPGYVVDPKNPLSCNDINECEIYATCSQECKNLKGSYECRCAEGYREVGSGHECAANGPPPVLLLMENVRIRKFNLQTTKYEDYIDEEERVGAVDYDWDHNGTGYSMVYFTVEAKGSIPGAIKRAYLSDVDDGSNNLVITVNLNITNIVKPDGIAVDWVGRNVYWTDARTKRIEVALLDGRYRKFLISSDLEQPTAIAVNPKLGLMYWTDWGASPKIESAWMDGQERKVLVDQIQGWPTGLTIDYANNDRVYWSDSKDNFIESMFSSGEDRRLVLHGDLKNPFSINVFEDHIYWFSKEKGDVFRQNKFGRGTKVKLLTVGPWLSHFSVYQQQRYSPASVANQCKGDCSHLCLLRPIGYTCACPQGSSYNPGSSTKCDAGNVPPPFMPPPCLCRNGATCYLDDNLAKCKCPPSWSGDFCQNKDNPLQQSVAVAVGVTAAVVVVLVFLVFAAHQRSNGRKLYDFSGVFTLPSFMKRNADTKDEEGFANVSYSLHNEPSVSIEKTSSVSTDAVAAEGGHLNFDNPTYTPQSPLGPGATAPASMSAKKHQLLFKRNFVETFDNPGYEENGGPASFFESTS
ncbi:low-density lipoprotein receptor-related protein 2 [Erpetoichthys calabaricus]|uniref:low-density lipoprotein receptor-related protein 2 n=1 Tax=Erpetoichthys calabaricus TaxID=27687 RepID=UPI002233FCBF|nr:low-density lipoprotein receptor-related protein 2 [Erpetoichthys calabaricus]